MATGLEALGATSAVLQVISFTHEVISVCKKVYDGKPTADDDLEDYAKEMSDAVVRVQTRCQAMKNSQQSEADKKLGKVANDCQICARELQDEVRFVTDMHKKGNIIKAVKAVLRASSHRKKLDRLELALFKHRQVMETEMLSLLCSRSDAQKLQHEQIFDKLDQDVQTLVAKISQGHTKLEDLVRNEHSATREVIVLETAKAQETINAHIATETQRKEFIKSLRFPEIKKRYNDLMDSREASFHRVFASYEKMTGSDEDDLETSENGNMARGDIDQAWAIFVEWLKSSVPLFCIQGKPGSGKSTLVKYIVDNKNTRQILCQHAQGTTILSHFFWKIGTSSQNSIKGLLCSLIYQMLVDDQDMLELVLNRQGSGSYSHYHDWSVNELKSIIECILEVRTYPLCIFVDGLDEICNADGLFKLTQLIEDVLAMPRIKICVASRPETLVLNWLEKHNVQGILLEDLTRPDMRSYVLKELEPSLLDRTISDRTHGKLTERLVRKSQGVFLWLYLALRSIIAGIRNQDTEETLLARLEELPGELEDLYADMWKRLNEDNSIYRKAAAKYFQYMLQSHRELCLGWQGASYNTKAFEFAQPILCQLACAESTEIQESLLNADNTIDLVKAQRLCDETKRAIQSRCAGLLQVRSPRDFRQLEPKPMKEVDLLLLEEVDFIHRTAHDFLATTEAGQEILSFHTVPKKEISINLFKGLFCGLRILHSEYGIRAVIMRILEQISLLPDDHGSEGPQEAIKFLPLVERLYNDDVLFPIARWLPKVQFLAYLATHECFDDFVISTITQARSTIYATVILREACSLGLSLETANGDCLPSRLVEALMSMGADAHARGVIGGPFFRTPEPFLSNETAFTNVLRFRVKSLFLNLYDDVDFAPRVLRSVVGMAVTCPDLSAKVLAPVRVWRNGAVTLEKFPPGEVIFRPFLGFFPLVLELDLKFLLSYLLSELACFDEDHTTTSQIEELLPKLANPTAKLRYVAFQGKESSGSTCGCVLSQESCPEIIERLFERGKNQLGSSGDAEDPEDTESTYEGIRRMAECLSVERVDHESMMLSLANENLGVCTFVEAGIKPPVAWLDAVEQDHLYPFPRTLEKLRASAGTEDDV